MNRTMNTVTLVAPDISCAHCVATVNTSVAALDGVIEVKADQHTKNVVVTYDPERVSEPGIRAALTEAGYPAKA